MRAIRALVWKDCRLNHVVLIVGAFLLVTPHLAALAWALRTELSLIPALPKFQGALLTASLYSLALSQLTLALLGGNVIACERVDRSAEFLAYLPPSRAMILASKAIVALGTALVIWGVNLPVFCFVVADIPGAPAYFGEALRYMAAIGALLFGVGWLGSSLLESPTFAIGLAIVSPIVVQMSLVSGSTWLGWPPSDDLADWFYRACLMLGPLCFVLGTWCFLRRVEP